MEEEEETLEDTANINEEAIFESDAGMDRTVANRDTLTKRLGQQAKKHCTTIMSYNLNGFC